MSRMWIVFAALVLSAFPMPATAEAIPPAPYGIQPLRNDPFVAPAVLESAFGGDYTRFAYVPVAESNRAAEALLASVPEPPRAELAFQHGGETIRYLAVGDLSKPAKMILIYLHGLGEDRIHGMREKQFGGAFSRLKRLAAQNDAVYISTDFSGYGRKAEQQVAALIADHASRSPGAPVFVACLSAGGKVCWRLAQNAGSASALRGVLLLGASADRDFLKRAASSRVQIYLGVGTKDKFARWKSQQAFFRDLKAVTPDYPIRLAVFEAGEHATAARLTDWVAVLNWMLAGAAARPAP